ncbi:MAG: hypothetical protein RIQ88_912 [Actinomycetota bacterium]|jgi:hypothetical protein
MTSKLGRLLKVVSPILLLASVFVGSAAPAQADGDITTIRLQGIDNTNAYERAGDAGYFVSQGWYAPGLRVFTKQLPVGSTNTLTYQVTTGGVPQAGVTVTLHINKGWSGSTAKVSVGSTVAEGVPVVDCGWGWAPCNDAATVTGVTDAQGNVSFELKNNDVAADAANYPAEGLDKDYTGTHLFSQITANVTGDATDAEDIVDFVFHKPADAPVVKTVVARMNGLDSTSAYEGSCAVGNWCQYYAAGLRYFEKGLTVGSTTDFSFTVTDTDGAAYANKSVYLLLGKGWSGSTAKVTVNGVSTSGADCWCGNDQARITLTTNAQGQVSFSLTSNDSAVDADPYQAGNLPHPNGGKHLFTQMTLVGEKGNADVLDIVDLNFYKDISSVPPTVYNARLADWNATNSFDGTHIWGDGGLGSWFDIYTGYFAHYVQAGTTFNLRYKVTLASNGANAPDGTPVTIHLGRGWSGSNAKFRVGDYTINGTYPNGQSNDQKSLSVTTVGGYATVSLTSLDAAGDATMNPGNPKANPDPLSPLFMQTGLTVDGNSITHQDWVNIIVTQPQSAPSISSVSATSGKRGQAIDIVGTNLGDALGSTVTLYTAATAKTAAISTPVTILSVSADGTRLTVASPNITQKGYFKVTNTGGTATASALFSSSTTATAKPVITLSSSIVKEIGSTFTLSGTNLASASTIAIGGVSAPFSILTANSVSVTVPAGVVSGSTISATNIGGTATTTKFVFQAAVIDSITQAARVGQTVTVTGSNLKATTVVFAGNKSAKPVINTATQLTFVVPAGALSGAIRITTGAGSVNTDSFTVTPPAPTIASFTPTTGKKGVATVTVKGTNLLGATVTIGSTAVTLGSGATATSFKFVIPAGASTGRITVTTAGGTVTSTATLTVTN